MGALQRLPVFGRQADSAGEEAHLRTDRPLRLARDVDLERFMGDWYVIAGVPTALERQAYNIRESYRLLDHDRVAVTYSFNRGGPNGRYRVFRPTARVASDSGNVVWRMQFVWPFRSDYRIVYVDRDYSHAIIGREKRDHVAIMARTPALPPDEYFDLVRLVREQGFDTSRLRHVPHDFGSEEPVRQPVAAQPSHR